MDINNTIIEPIITEKITALQENSQYAFRVGAKATKTQIKKMFELMFGSKVGAVRIMIVPRKTRLLKGKNVFTKRPKHKKAIITLKKGEKAIDINKIKFK